MPVFTHYGVELWVPEVGGPIDPDSEAHDLIMSVFGGMSKGERNRIKLRVRAAMAARAAVEGRFLGGRPPYGYRIADAGPHPNPAKAADGKRLHKLEPDPETARVVRRIFAEYLAGRGLFAIAEGLTRDRIPSPSQHDAARNTHRTGQGWATCPPPRQRLRPRGRRPARHRQLAVSHLRAAPAHPDHHRATSSPGTTRHPPPLRASPGHPGHRRGLRRPPRRYQATLDAGGDPQTIAEWTRQVKAERAVALAREATRARSQPTRRLTEDDIRALITALGNLRDVIRDAGPA
jgi:hypothetical protein